MKYLRWALLLIWGFEIFSYSQSVPEKMNYQGRIMVDNLPYTGYTNVIVAIFDTQTGGTALYADTQTVYVSDGFYSLIVGASNTVGLHASLSSGNVYLETVIGSSIMAPREPIVSSAYALNALRAQSADSALPLAGGVMTGPLTNNKYIHIYSWTNLNTTVKDIAIGKGTRAYSTLRGSVAIGTNATARYRTAGVAIGTDADGDYNGVALGYSADGQYSNIAIGYQASTYSGYDRIAIGRDITNRRNNSAVIRGTLYLDGGTGLLYRSTKGTGSWTPKAFTIPHPLAPNDWVLRHYCLESPVVWNVYAGNTILKNGKATVVLPDYYSELNLEDSEIYDLTAVGAPAALYIETEVENGQFVIAGDANVKVSWTIKVQRNDPGCNKGLEEFPVEQPASEIKDHQLWLNSYPFY